jgi:chemotaxis protein CheX
VTPAGCSGQQIVSEQMLEQHSDVIEIVQRTVQQVFATMLALRITNGLVEIDKRPLVPNAGTVAMVGMAGAVSGNGCLCLSKNLSCRLASALLMTQLDEVNDEVLDAVAELANMIIGGLKTELEESAGPMGLSVPTVIFSEHYITRTPTIGDRFTMQFTCEDQGWKADFSVQICLIVEKSNRSYLQELAEFHAKLA